MAHEYSAIFIDQSGDAAEQFRHALSAAISFSHYDITSNLHEALQSYIREGYDICFLSESLQPEQIQIFFADVLRAGRKGGTIFVQYRKHPPKDAETKELRKQGFHAAISSAATERDLRLLNDALLDIDRERLIIEKSDDIEGALRVVLKQLDVVAKERKRGMDRRLSSPSFSIISANYHFDPAIAARYFEMLEASTRNGKPITQTRIKVPPVVLSRNLPGLREDLYVGNSHRVWKMLLNQHPEHEEEPPRVTVAEESTDP